MSILFDNLTKYGVNFKITMARFMGDEELYVHCLEKYFEGEEFAQLKLAMEDKDYKRAFDYAHNIKGITGNLGLDPLYEKVCMLVELLRHGITDNIDEIYATVVHEKDKLEEIWEKSR